MAPQRIVGRSTRLLALGVVAALALLAGACGAASDPAREDPRPEGRAGASREGGSTEASTFSVGQVPEGFEPVRMGEGQGTQRWGVDGIGTDEPFTVLSPRGAPTEPDRAVVVSQTGFAGYQGGLAQAAGDDGVTGEETTVDGNRAFISPGSEAGQGELVVQRGDDLAIRVTAPGADRDELVGIEAAVEPGADRRSPPTVPEPPGDLEVVGSVSAALDIAIGWSGDVAGLGELPMLPGTLVRTWGRPDAHLSVAALPGNRGDLDALATLARRTNNVELAGSTDVGGRPAVALIDPSTTAPDGPGLRTLVTTTTWGDLLVVGSLGEPALTTEEMRRIAGSVERLDPQRWQEEVASVGAVDGPDPGTVELARGDLAGTGYLIQVGPEAAPSAAPPGGAGARVIPDPQMLTLRLDGGRRANAAGSGGGAQEAWVTFDLGTVADPPAPAAVVVMTTQPRAASLKATTPDGATEERPFRTATTRPDGPEVRTALVPGIEGALPACRETPGTAPIPTIRVEVLDAAGAVLRCVGV